MLVGLQIRDHGHADDADHQLHPPVCRRSFAQFFLDYRSHMPLPPLIVFLRLGTEQLISRSANIPSGNLRTYNLVRKTLTFVLMRMRNWRRSVSVLSPDPRPLHREISTL
jgi:hypothetical protein